MKAQGLSDGEPRTLTCEDWMTSEMQTAEPLDSIAHARELLRQHRINQLPIVKDGILVGIATDRDLRKLEHVPQPSHEIPIEAVMSHDVITLEPHSTVIDAALILRRKRIGSVPIVNSGRLVGIVTRSDILEAFILRERRRGRSGSASA